MKIHYNLCIIILIKSCMKNLHFLKDKQRSQDVGDDFYVRLLPYGRILQHHYDIFLQIHFQCFQLWAAIRKLVSRWKSLLLGCGFEQILFQLIVWGNTTISFLSLYCKRCNLLLDCQKRGKNIRENCYIYGFNAVFFLHYSPC